MAGKALGSGRRFNLTRNQAIVALIDLTAPFQNDTSGLSSYCEAFSIYPMSIIAKLLSDRYQPTDENGN
jgi:hypothetical protein